MISGKSSPYYGQLMTKNLPSEIKKLWYSRNEELEPLPSWRWSFEMESNLDHVEERDFLTKILAVKPLLEREEKVIWLVLIEEQTFKDVGLQLGVTQERVRQIYLKAIRKLRTGQKEITGITLWSMDCEVTTWNRYKYQQRNA
jgi:RNA polymerase sigma factor (sigma-70 family)